MSILLSFISLLEATADVQRRVTYCSKGLRTSEEKGWSGGSTLQRPPAHIIYTLQILGLVTHARHGFFQAPDSDRECTGLARAE